jgi:signal transduction histidine kinase
MGSIAGSDAYLIFAIQSAVLAVVSLGILWSARGTAVYLYLSSGLFTTLYYAAFLVAEAGEAGFGLIGSLGVSIGAIGGAWLKNVSLGLLESPSFPISGYLKGSALILVGMLSIPFLFPDPAAFSLILGLSVVGIMARVIMLAHRIGTRIHSLAAKLFVVLIGLQLILIFASGIAGLMTDSPILSPVADQSVASISLTLSINLVNVALFGALVLDISIRERDLAQRDRAALEVYRSRAHEREMLLADMHDGLGSQIATARLRVERGEMSQAEVAHLLRECSSDLHLMVDTLREQNDSLEAALVDYKTRIERRIIEHGIGLSWTVQLGGAPSMAPRRMLQVLRVIQEAINNAIRHAGAREIIVTVRYMGDREYVIKVEDDGAGIADDVALGRGVSNMRRRARELGGSFEIRRRARNSGTEVYLSFGDRPV